MYELAPDTQDFVLGCHSAAFQTCGSCVSLVNAWLLSLGRTKHRQNINAPTPCIAAASPSPAVPCPALPTRRPSAPAPPWWAAPVGLLPAATAENRRRLLRRRRWRRRWHPWLLSRSWRPRFPNPR